MRRKTIHIKWSRRVPIYDYEFSDHAQEIGVYMITRIWGEAAGNPRDEKILYIGKTIDSFQNRMASHTSQWTTNLRGNVYVRFGTIQNVTDLDNDLLEDIESVLICHEQPEENKMKTRSYTFRTEYLPFIVNMGCGDVITREIDAKDQIDWSTVE